MSIRRPIFIVLGILAALGLLNACHKTEDSKRLYDVTEKDAAIIIANHLLPQYGGLILQSENSIADWRSFSGGCQILKDSVFAGTNPAGSYISYSYQLVSHRETNCLSRVFTVDYQGGIKTEGSTFISTDQINGNFSLAFSDPVNCWLTGVSERTGLQRVKGTDVQPFNSAVNIRIDSLLMNSQKRKIIKGSASVKMTGSAASNFVYTGVFIFSGSNKGVLTLNSGKAYALTW